MERICRNSDFQILTTLKIFFHGQQGRLKSNPPAPIGYYARCCLRACPRASCSLQVLCLHRSHLQSRTLRIVAGSAMSVKPGMGGAEVVWQHLGILLYCAAGPADRPLPRPLPPSHSLPRFRSPRFAARMLPPGPLFAARSRAPGA